MYLLCASPGPCVFNFPSDHLTGVQAEVPAWPHSDPESNLVSSLPQALCTLHSDHCTRSPGGPGFNKSMQLVLHKCACVGWGQRGAGSLLSSLGWREACSHPWRPASTLISGCLGSGGVKCLADTPARGCKKPVDRHLHHHHPHHRYHYHINS